MLNIVKQLTSIFSQKKIYWILKKNFDLFQFHIVVRMLEQRARCKRTLLNIKDLLSSTKWELIFVCLFVPLVLYFSFPFSLGAGNGNKDYYIEILSVIAGIGGVIIALFHTAMISLANSVYLKMPPEAKNLLNNDPVGVTFVRILTFLTLGCIVLLALNYYGAREFHYIIPILIIFTGVSIFSLAKIGHRLFHFTDPTLLAVSTLNIFEDTIKISGVHSLGWNNRHIQNHYGKTIALNIRTLETLMGVAKDNHGSQDQSLSIMANICLKSVKFYIEKKRFIPEDSYFHLCGEKK